MALISQSLPPLRALCYLLAASGRERLQSEAANAIFKSFLSMQRYAANVKFLPSWSQARPLQRSRVYAYCRCVARASRM